MKIEKLLDERQMNGKVGLFAKVTIPPRDVLEFHEHHGETETYYILSGEGSTTMTAERCLRKREMSSSAKRAMVTASAVPERKTWYSWR